MGVEKRKALHELVLASSQFWGKYSRLAVIVYFSQLNNPMVESRSSIQVGSCRAEYCLGSAFGLILSLATSTSTSPFSSALLHYGKGDVLSPNEVTTLASNSTAFHATTYQYQLELANSIPSPDVTSSMSY